MNGETGRGCPPLGALARLGKKVEVSRLRAKHLEHLDPEVLTFPMDATSLSLSARPVAFLLRRKLLE